MSDFSAIFFHFRICKIKLGVETQVLSSILICNCFAQPEENKKTLRCICTERKSNFCECIESQSHRIVWVGRDI